MSIKGSILYFLSLAIPLFGALSPLHSQKSGIAGQEGFIPDQGQWHSKVRFKSKFKNGSFYLEEKGFTYQRVDGDRIEELHHRTKKDRSEREGALKVDAHAVKVKLLGASTPTFEKRGRSEHYTNYFLGDDPKDWASKVHSYRSVWMSSVYRRIDMEFERKPQGIKYSFHCDPGSHVQGIRMQYRGQNDLALGDEGKLRIRTSLGSIIEKAPRAFQWIDGSKKEVPCRFRLQDNIVRFEFPEGYSKEHPLIIDPNVIFSSYTGSNSDNWGNTATFDSDGALYAGGTVFGSGYPTTPGAYQLNFGGGQGGLGCDVSISKFAPDGSSLIYSTYLGGSANELPHSLVVGPLDQLYILGSTGSSDFPVDSNGVQTNFLGGSNNSAFGAIDFNSGTDAFVSKLSGNGSSLLASTYLGGSSNDGLNEANDLNFNYGDILRGEIEVDGSGNAYVVSTTRSNDLPVTSGVLQPNLAGGQDAFISKLNPDLSNLLFCTYYGGSSNDAGYAIERNPGTGIYISGGTKSSDIPLPQGWQTSPQGGVDGYVARVDGNGANVLDASYIGTSGYDQSYFVGRDSSDNILLYGQSDGGYPVQNAGYSNPNSGQFVQMLPSDLSGSIFSTVFGTGSGDIDISPSAFMVSQCNNIYLSGWGGNVNQGHGVNSSSTNGLPTTSDAYQTSTDGSDFYLMVLSDSASSLKYASFFGGGVSDEHVDGGTSRFDEEGVVYQAVCGGCGGNSDFPTTPEAHSSENNSSNCNLAAFKFDMSELSADIDFQNTPLICHPGSLDFEFSGTGGTYYEWHFGDGTMDSGQSVSHQYSDTGSYQVSLIVHDTLTCQSTDTARETVRVVEPDTVSVDPVEKVCPGDSVELTATGGTSYEWFPTEDLSDPDSSTTLAYPPTERDYRVVMTDPNGCKDTTEAEVKHFTEPEVWVGNDLKMEWGSPVNLYAQGGPGTYLWHPESFFENPGSQQVSFQAKENRLYWVEYIDTNGCRAVDSILVEVSGSLYAPNAFTPDGDGVNDIWRVKGENIGSFQLKIFNRWGELLFETRDMEEGWDGQVDGEPAKQDVYVYRITYTEAYKPEIEKEVTGHITLIR